MFTSKNTQDPTLNRPVVCFLEVCKDNGFVSAVLSNSSFSCFFLFFHQFSPSSFGLAFVGRKLIGNNGEPKQL